MTSVTGLLGRDDELARLRDLIAGQRSRFVTVTGPPGVGKTRLARTVAPTCLAPGVAITTVELGAVSDPGRVLAEIALALGIDPRGVEQQPELLAKLIGSGPMLLFLDDCDRVVDAGPDLAALLRATLGLVILATSRERFRLVQERELALPPLSSPERADDTNLDRLRASPAVQLFVARARAATPDFGLTPENAPAVSEICRRLDGLPLAIELAAARTRLFTPTEIGARLHQRMTLLVAGPRDSSPRHRSLRTALDWSVDLLTEDERAVFRRLSLFTTSANLAAIEAVCGEPGWDLPEILDSLLHKSLILRLETADASSRYGMLESLRELGFEKLATAGELEHILTRLSGYLAELSITGEQSVGTADEPEWLAWLSQVAPDLRRAFDHSRQTGADDAATSLAVSLAWFSHVRGHVREGSELLHDFMAAAGRDGDDRTSTAAALAGGVLAYGCGEAELSQRLLTRAIAVSEDREDSRRTAVGLSFLGHVHRSLEEPAAAEHAYERAMAIYERDGNRWGAAWSRHDLGVLARDQGDLDAADRLLAESLHWFRDVDHTWAGAWAAWGLGAVRLDSGERDGLSLVLEALRTHQEVGDLRGVAESIGSVAEAATLAGDPVTAARLLGAAYALRCALAGPGKAQTDVFGRGPTAPLRHALGDDLAEHEWETGRKLPLAAAVSLAESVHARPPTAADAAGLTPREREVAAYVATGRTNRAIARSLGIAEKTVEVHLSHVMTKIEAQSRAAVAAWTVAHGLPRPKG